MPKRIPLQTVIFQRDKQRMVPEVGKPFDFTKEEIEQITKLNPDALGKLPTEQEQANDKLVSMTQEQVDEATRRAAEDAVAAYKKANGIKDDVDNKDGAGAGSNTGAAKTAADAKSAKGADKKSPADDGDI